jgi:hypothetical protein
MIIGILFVVTFIVGILSGAILAVIGLQSKVLRIKKKQYEITQRYYSPLTGSKIEQNIN